MFESSKTEIATFWYFMFFFLFDTYISLKSLGRLYAHVPIQKGPEKDCPNELSKFEEPDVLVLTVKTFRLYLFSAFYDPRATDIDESYKLVRILALVNNTSMNLFTESKLSCAFYDKTKNLVLNDMAGIYSIRTKINIWSGYIISCEIPDVKELPCFVSVVYDQKLSEKPFVGKWLPVRISIKNSLHRTIILQRLDMYARKTSTVSTVPPHEIAVNMDIYWDEIYSRKRPKNAEFESSFLTYQMSYSICIPFAVEREPKFNLLNLFEFIEYNSNIGVERIVFYTRKKFSGLFRNIYKYYNSNDILDIEVVVWPPVDVEERLARRLSIQDCLHRNIGVSKYLAIHDFDEVVLSNSNGNMLKTIMLQNDVESSILAVKGSRNASANSKYYGRYVFIVRPEYIFDLDIDNSIRPIRREIKMRHISERYIFFKSLSNCFKDFHCNSSYYLNTPDENNIMKIYSQTAYAMFKNWMHAQLKQYEKHFLI